jgi:hypothetical protein
LHEDGRTFQGAALSPLHSAKRHVAEAGMNEPAKITEGVHKGKMLLVGIYCWI